MNLETCKKVLKIAGICTIVIGVLGVILGIVTLSIGGASTGLPEVQAGEDQAVQGAAALIGSGIVAIISSVISVVEGICSYRAGKSGKSVTAALVFAVLGVISNIGTFFQSSGASAGTIIGNVIALALSCLVAYAAYMVRKAAKEQEAAA